MTSAACFASQCQGDSQAQVQSTVGRGFLCCTNRCKHNACSLSLSTPILFMQTTTPFAKAFIKGFYQRHVRYSVQQMSVHRSTCIHRQTNTHTLHLHVACTSSHQHLVSDWHCMEYSRSAKHAYIAHCIWCHVCTTAYNAHHIGAASEEGQPTKPNRHRTTAQAVVSPAHKQNCCDRISRARNFTAQIPAMR